MGRPVIDKNLFKFQTQSQSNRLKHLTFFDITRKPHLGSVFMSCKLMQELQAKNVELNVMLFDYSFIEHEDTHRQNVCKIDIYREYFKNIAPLTGLNYSTIKFIDAIEFLRNSPECIWGQLQELSKKVELDIPVYRNCSKNFHLESYLRELFYLTAIKFFDPDIYHSGNDEGWGHKLLAEPSEFNDKIMIRHDVLPKLSAKIVISENLPFNLANKMTKNDEATAILCNENSSELANKINSSFCQEGNVEYNAVLNWIKETVYSVDRDFRILRPAKWGGDMTLSSYDELVERFKAKGIRPSDLKNSFADYFTNWTQQLRKELDQPQVFEAYSYVYDKK